MTTDLRTTVSASGHLLWNGNPYGPHFADADDAQEFVDLVAAKTGLDPRQQSDEWLERAAARFIEGEEV